jgi:ABC-type glycerol-3-phosphate transport system substrate-binding protein
MGNFFRNQVSRRNLVSSLSLLLLILLAACNPAQSATPHVSVIGPWKGGEREAFMTVIDAFTAKTHIPVSYESMQNDMGAILRTRLSSGNPPDIAFDPRPGEVAEFARAGNLVDLGTFIPNDDLSTAFGQSYIDLGKVDGKQVGIFFKANSKSTFWYKPKNFAQFGLQPPKTLNELFAIANQLRVSGRIPFAVGGQDGWVLSDYQENLLARLVDPQTYYGLYRTHTVPWTDPKVKQSLVLFTDFFQLGDEPGNSPSVLNTSFVDSIGQVFGPNPTAEMLYEGGFVGVIAATDVNLGLRPSADIDFFPFPQVDPLYGDPVVGGGDTAIMFRDSPEGRAFMQFLITKEAADVLASANTISPNKQVDPTKFKSPLARQEYRQLVGAKVFVFDGSDLAPSSFGGDFELSELQKLVQYPGDVDKIAQELEDYAKSAY